ncbi:MAG: rod shape-determining protein MreC [Sedimentisphaerales bacterium]|nr:rod shape-determining protein MreC [Sedimentisphaerales bacterium]
MARKRIRITSRMLFVWFLLAGFILLFCPAKITSKFQFAFARIFRWPLNIGKNMSLSARTSVAVQDESARKESQYQNYIVNLEEELRRKNEQIRQLTGIRTRLRGFEGAKLAPAEIITSSTEGQRCELIINRGSDDGLAKGFYVIGDNSVIGIVTDLSARTAKVRLLTDTSSAVQVNIAGIEANMLMQGDGKNLAKIKMVPAKHKIKVGDPVLVRRKPGLLDIAMIAGAVQQCKRDDKNASLWEITVKPVCDTARLNDVAVIIMNPAK